MDIGSTTQNIANLLSQGSGKGTVSLSGGKLTAGAMSAGMTLYAGNFVGTGTIVKVGSGTWRLNGDSRNYDGAFQLEGGRFQLESQYALGEGRQTTALAGTAVQTVGSLRVAGGIKFTATQNGSGIVQGGVGGNALNASGAGTTVVYDNLLTLDRQGTGNGQVKYGFFAGGTGSQRMEFAGGISTSGNTLGSVVLDANVLYSKTAVMEFSGEITDVGGPALTLYSVGVGTTLLSRAEGNTHRGGVAVWGATTVLVNNETGSGTGYGGVNFNSGSQTGAVLGGTGRIAPQGASGLAMGAGSTLAPGSGGAGFLTMDLVGTSGKARFLDGAKFRFDLGTDSDRMVFVGTSLGDVVFTNNVIDFQLGAGFAPGTYTLFSFDAAGAYTGTLVLGTGLEAYAGSSLIYTANAIQLQVVPEPSAIVLTGISAVALLLGRRRRPIRDDAFLC